MGIQVQRERQTGGVQYSEKSDSEEDEPESIGVKIIVFDEEIKKLVPARNISPYGYLALIGESKLSIYLAYAEDESCTYDHVWTISFWSLRKEGIGKSIEVIDFSPNCEDFVAYMNSGKIVTFSIKRTKFMDCCATLSWKYQCPVTELRSYMNNKRCVAFSKPNNLLMLLDLESLAELPKEMPKRSEAEKRHIIEISPSAEGFGNVENFQVDNSEKFLICAFSNNKVGVFDLLDGSLLLEVDDLDQCQSCLIDESGAFMAMLDVNRRQMNISSMEWQWEVEQPIKPKRQLGNVNEEQESNLFSDD